MIAFQKKNDASILILSDNQTNEENDSYPIIISYPQKINTDPDIILKMIADTSEELLVVDKVIYKYLSQVSYFLQIFFNTIFVTFCNEHSLNCPPQFFFTLAVLKDRTCYPASKYEIH